MTTRPSPTQREYIARVNRVVDYIWANFNQELTHEGLAGIACFSKFHFHRIFSAIMGETLTEFIRRVRLERAMAWLINDRDTPITSIAIDCGFSSPSVFARAFKERFGMSASRFRQDGAHRNRKESILNSNVGQALRNGCEAQLDNLPYAHEYHSQPWRHSVSKLKYTAEVKELPELHVAYVRHLGPYHKIGEAFERLSRWAGPRGLLGTPKTKILAIYHDNPEVTEEAKLQSSACVSLPEGTPVGGEIGELTVPGGTFVVGHFEISDGQFKEAWDALLGEWLPNSGYQCDDRMCYELYLNDNKEHPEHKHILDICEPIKPL